MSRDSIANAKTELYNLLQVAGVPNIAGVTAVYRFEPAAGNAARPVAITISSAGLLVDDYRIRLRIYVTAQVDVQVAQDTLDAVIMLVESKMSSGFPRTNFTIGYDPELDAFVGEAVFEVGREDHF